MSSYDLFLALGNVKFGVNDNHRYKDIDSKFIIAQQFSNARMIKNNTIDIPLAFDNVNKFNYGYYHTKLDSKKYFFFITSCDYINDSVTRITFKVDWFSTDFKNITFKTSYVERMHPTLNTLATYPRTYENLGNEFPLVTNYIDQYTLDYDNAYYIIATTHAIPTKKDFTSETSYSYETLINNDLAINGLFKPIPQKLHAGELNYTYIITNNLVEVNTFINNALGLGYSSAIGGIWRVPSIFNDYVESYTIETNNALAQYSETVNILMQSDSILILTSLSFTYPNYVDGYTPVYKKCLDYQFINPCLLLNDTQIVFSYALFKTQENQENTIGLFFDAKGDSNIYAVPFQYNGSNEYDFTNSVSTTISVPVQISADNSIYIQDKRVQNLQSLGKTTLQGIVSSTTNVLKNALSSSLTDKDFNVTTNILGEGISLASNVMNTAIENNYSLFNVGRGATILGNTGNTTIAKLSDYGKNLHLGFQSYCTQDIQRIDKFFSMFGYRYNTLMIPQLRDTYTYLKGDINFVGDINNESYDEIKKMFAQGVTIWSSDIYEYDV